MKTDSSTPSNIHILCCTDSNYCPYAGVMLTSLLENNRHHHIDIHVATTDTNPDNHTRLAALADKYGCGMHIIHVTQSELDSLPDAQCDWPKEAYLRFTAITSLPQEVTRVLYLDCDIIVNTDIGDIWNHPLNGKAAAAVPDINNYILPHRRRLHISSQYFNSGVMLMDIDRCKALDLTSRCLQIISTTTLDYPDQDALNMALEGEVVYLPQKWNLVDGYLQTRYYKRLPSKIKKLVHAAMTGKRNAIIHYTGLYKPWRIGTYMFHPLYAVWKRFYHKSPWKNTDLWHRIPASAMKRIVISRLKIMYILGITSSYNHTWIPSRHKPQAL